ncbi:aldo/keto reductase [Pseudodonghicola flavimaris]|uniref:Aldo/keto reductase n=1 Tax=Pseudodonghicola flavimaris TaxID=3050036 RepID=A0ABT7F2L6_9RHOB|nr:aldo/keto reductase [Pseudodonghicola flavimaris]MDK3018838.1 aldo/keto reductase [Pseudodonghicola flavimaris]
MEMRQLGKTGLKTAPIVFGGNVFGWTADEAESFRILDAFVDHGFNAIDTADVYSAWAPGHKGGESESVLGKWLAARPGMRDRITLFTKVGFELGPEEKGLSEAWILKAVDNSLARLGIETIDLYFSHTPDASVTHAETLGAYDKLLKAGKIRAIGASNYDAEMLGAALEVSEREGLPAYQVLQPEYNLYDRAGFEGALADFCIDNDIAVVTYFSLASGFLSGKYRSEADLEGRARAHRLHSYMNPRGMALLDALEAVAATHGARPAEVALAWVMARPGVTAPIASATSVAQVESFARAATLRLSAEEMGQLTSAGA